MRPVTVLGGGLAGSEAALQLAARGIPVRLIEMRPGVTTPAHRTPGLAELVCSNSLKSTDETNASGLLKKELGNLGCMLLEAARSSAVPAGHALAVDREEFSSRVTRIIEDEHLIELVRREQEDLDLPGEVIVATGPLTSPSLSRSIIEHFGEDSLHFYDAISISIGSESIERTGAFSGSRYGKGGDDYLNVPFDEEQYSALVGFLRAAPRTGRKDFESGRCFEACLPVEEMAQRGEDALRYGPLKPRGLVDPRTGSEPYAVLQLRQEKLDGSILGLVGFQTRLTRPAQRKMLSLVPGLRNAEIVRWGAIHRNTFIDSPRLLESGMMSKRREGLYFAGQITGVEGYVESIAHGLLAALDLAARLRGEQLETLPPETMTGALFRYLTEKREDFQPMNANLGLLPPVKGKRRERRVLKAERAIEALLAWEARNHAAVRDV